MINTTHLITRNQGGYIVMSHSEKPQEISIMDTPDIFLQEEKSGGGICRGWDIAQQE